MNDKELAIALFALLERENAISIPQIATLLGSDEETIWNLLEDLLFAYDSVQIPLRLDKNHAQLMRSETSRVLRLNASETALLLDALEAHGLTSDDELVRKLVETKGFLGEAHVDTDGTSASIRTRSHGTQAGVLEQLASACEDIEHRVIAIEYHKEGATGTQTRLLEPHAIHSDGDHTLLEAYDRERGGWRTFRIDRVREVRVLEEHFDPKEPEETEAARTAVLLFAEGHVPEDWPGLKQLRTHDDGCVEGSIPWYGSLWLPKKIIAHGKTRVVKPPELAQAVVDYANSLL